MQYLKRYNGCRYTIQILYTCVFSFRLKLQSFDIKMRYYLNAEKNTVMCTCLYFSLHLDKQLKL